LTKQQVEAVFLLAGIEVLAVYQISNEYWGNDYEMQARFPWWLVKTPAGLIKIGWRKRVINIDWSDVGLLDENKVTQDDVTKCPVLVHAWGYCKAIEYLANLKQLLDERLSSPELAVTIDAR
jgi:hypothetical protein